MKKKIIAVIFLFIFSKTFLYGIENPFPLPPSVLSASYSEGSFSSLLNPVFTDMNSAEDIAYRYAAYNNGDSGNHFLSASIYHFNFIYARYNTIPDLNGNSILDSGVNLYSINRGFFFGNVFGFGAGFSFGKSSDDYFNDYRGWNIGLLYRPYPFLSLGVVFKDLNGKIGSEKINRSDIYSISIRPFIEYLTLSADCVKKEGKSFKDADYYYSGELKAFKDISLMLKYGADKSFTAGITIPFYLRVENSVEITLDAYGSKKAETSDLKSTGVAVRFRQNSKAVAILPTDNFVKLSIRNNYNKEKIESGFFSKNELTFKDLVIGLEQAGNDPGIKGFIIEIDNLSFGMAQIQELRDLLNKFRSRGKRVYSILNYSGNREYYLATASDKIFMPPNTTFKITGLTLKTYYIKGLLDKGGIKYESVNKGKYKSFNEAFTRENMSDYSRENLTAVLRNLNEQFITGIMEERKIARSNIDELFSKGSYTPDEAKEKGFIDEIMYANEAMDSLEKKITAILFDNYIKEEMTIRPWGNVPAIAVIDVTGSIVSGQGGGIGISDLTNDYDYKTSIEAAFNDTSVKAIVIRIDSGGGSAAASDFMWNTLIHAKKKNPKPVVFSFGNTAASGGYYIACTGDPIFASKGTITGSIGVVAGKISLEELYSKLGISTETIKMSEFADIFSESRSLTQKEKDLFQKEIDFIYDKFTSKVMASRNLSKDEIAEVSEGRIHSGDMAKKYMLINETGGFIAAIEYAKIKGGINSDYRIINLSEKKSIIKNFIGSSGISILSQHMRFIVQNIEKYSMLNENVLYIQPYAIMIE
ncbi:MAG: signal peptide peptidase SppA [Spirochaetes bacterium]|nr:signal peptide peptidase SppA [Spirochaetota bacterium]